MREESSSFHELELAWMGRRERMAASTVAGVVCRGISSREEVGWDIAVIAGPVSVAGASSRAIASASGGEG